MKNPNSEELDLLHIYIDADACPVKQEVYRVAKRYSLHVTLVANAWMRVPNEPWLILKQVEDGFDAADDWEAVGCAGAQTSPGLLGIFFTSVLSVMVASLPSALVNW